MVSVEQLVEPSSGSEQGGNQVPLGGPGPGSGAPGLAQGPGAWLRAPGPGWDGNPPSEDRHVGRGRE